MRSIVYALLLAGLAMSTALIHAGAWAGEGLDTALPGQFGVAHAQQAPDQRPFITTWRTDAANQTITIPLLGTGLTVHWGDGTNSTATRGVATHTYADPGTYAV